MDRSASFPIGAALNVATLTASPYQSLAAMRAEEPVSWVPALGAWFVTRRDLAIEAMLDADRYTVDDERFTTARVAQLYTYVGGAMGRDDAGLISELVADEVLTEEGIPAAVAVVMFGAIETSEAMTANALWHLFTHPDVLDRLRADQTLLPDVIVESLRLEPAASWVDRYTTGAPFELDLTRSSPPHGLIFRKPDALSLI